MNQLLVHLVYSSWYLYVHTSSGDGNVLNYCMLLWVHWLPLQYFRLFSLRSAFLHRASSAVSLSLSLECLNASFERQFLFITHHTHLLGFFSCSCVLLFFMYHFRIPFGFTSRFIYNVVVWLVFVFFGTLKLHLLTSTYVDSMAMGSVWSVAQESGLSPRNFRAPCIGWSMRTDTECAHVVG